MTAKQWWARILLLLIGGAYVWYTRKRAGGARVSLKSVKSEPKKKKDSIVRMSVDRSSKPQRPTEKEPPQYVNEPPPYIADAAGGASDGSVDKFV